MGRTVGHTESKQMQCQRISRACSTTSEVSASLSFHTLENYPTCLKGSCEIPTEIGLKFDIRYATDADVVRLLLASFHDLMPPSAI